ncbi:MAG: TIGR01777 family oxidoreductase [Chloroflexi bacterium]|nr:TIGR01777 family oxidoreductase [Chloroflexota bacterium]
MSKSMRIVIIGGNGFIGRSLTAAAKIKGHQITILSRRVNPKTSDQGDLVIKHWDGRSAESLAPLIEQSDVLINLAGENIGKQKWTKSRKEALLKSRLEPASAVVAAFKLAKNPPKTLIQASAIGIYGIGEETKTERSEIGKDYLAGFAHCWEESTKSIERMGVRRVVIRTGIVLDRNEGVLPKLMLPFRMMIGGPLGAGSQILSWIHIQDVVGGILFLIESEQCQGTYNLVSPDPVSNELIGKSLAKMMHRPYWIPAPSFVLKAVLGEMSTLVLEGQKVIPQRLIQEGYTFKYVKIEDALFNILRENQGKGVGV